MEKMGFFQNERGDATLTLDSEPVGFVKDEETARLIANAVNAQELNFGLPNNVGQIRDGEKVPEGKLLKAAIAIMSTESRTKQVPDEILNDIKLLAEQMYSPVSNPEE